MCYNCIMTHTELHEALRRIGWSQRQFAARLSVDEATVSRWVVGSRPIPAYVTEVVRLLLLAKQALEGGE